jgi:hypothetical protein
MSFPGGSLQQVLRFAPGMNSSLLSLFFLVPSSILNNNFSFLSPSNLLVNDPPSSSCTPVVAISSLVPLLPHPDKTKSAPKSSVSLVDSEEEAICYTLRNWTIPTRSDSSKLDPGRLGINPSLSSPLTRAWSKISSP